MSTGGYNYNIISQQNELNKEYNINSKIKEVPTKDSLNLNNILLKFMKNMKF